MRSRLDYFCILLTLLTSCTTQPSTDKLTHKLQSVKSWLATTNMVADAWLRGAVPQIYAKQTLFKAQQELQTEIDNIEKIQPSTPTVKNYKLKIQKQIERLGYTVKQMSLAVEK